MLTLGPTLTLAPTATQRVPGPEGAERPASPEAATRLAPPEPKAAPSPSLLHMSAPASQRLLIVAVPLRTLGPIRVSTDARGEPEMQDDMDTCWCNVGAERRP